MKKSRSLSPAELKKFRSDVAKLKRAGVVKNIDARSARPDQVRQGKRLSTWLDRYDDVVSGKAAAIPKSKFKRSQLAELRRTHEVRDGKIIEPHAATEKVFVTRTGKIKINERKPDIERIDFPLAYKDLGSWLKKLDRRSGQFEGLKGANRFWGYKIAGNRSWNYYDNLSSMMEDLINGAVSGGGYANNWRKTRKRSRDELFGQLEIFTFNRRSLWPERGPEKFRHKKQRKKSKKKRKTK